VSGVRVGVAPGIEPRLVRDTDRRESLAEYRADGGYRKVPDPAALLDLVDAAGLRGRGGASFPTGRKLRAVRAGSRRPVVVANGEEGEPTSVKDRGLLRTRPHLVLDGVLHAAAAVGADLAYVYVSDLDAERSVADAISELDPPVVELRVVLVEPGYVAGEETAAVRFLNGGPATPTDKPPRPFESGVDGRPTLVSNVETLANLPVLTRLGAGGYRALGTAGAPGTFLLTLGGRCAAPGLYELPLGTPMGAALDALGGTVDRPTGFLMGGYFGGLLNERGLDVALDYDATAAAGSGLGCGAVTVLGPRDCPVRVAAEVMAYFDRENAGQCGSCFNGTAAMSGTLAGLVAQAAGPEDVERLRRWSVQLVKRGACGTLDGAAHLAASLLREFPEAVQVHLDGGCADCAEGAEPAIAAPFAVEPPGARAELLGS
jgi:NADH:ubiquinone oxidoreductase subunit F (NADH-binding)